MKKESSIRLTWNRKRNHYGSDAEAVQANAKDRYFVTDFESEVKGIDPKNLSSYLIDGDCLDALPIIAKDMKDCFRVIYIDPPYNTGKQFTYRDKSTAEDWLDFMSKVLPQAQQLLRDDGLIFISIDDNQMHYLRCLLDEVFGKENFIQNFMWLHGKGKKDSFSRTMQQYILCYAKDRKKCTPWKVTVERHYDNLNNPDNDSRGEWFSGSISFQEKRSNSAHRNYYTITSPSGIDWTRQWLCDEETMTQYLLEKRIYFGTHPTYQSVPRLKIFPPVYQEIIPPNLIENVGTSRSATKELSQMFDGVAVFDFPKPVSLIQYLIEPIVQDGDWVLDFFAGSGTTAHAVYECQKLNIDCRVVLVQKSEAILKDTTISYCSKNSIEPTILGLCEERLRRMSQPENPFVFTKLRIGTNTKNHEDERDSNR